MTPRAPSRRREAPIRALRAILAVGIISGCSRSSGPEHPAGEEAEEPVSVLVAPVRAATFTHTLKAMGTCGALPDRLVAVSPIAEGAVVEVLVVEGDTVAAGQPIVRLDERFARGDVSEKTALKVEREASLALLRAPPRDLDRRVAELEVERARASADLARAVVSRLEPLNARREISDQELYEARQKLEDQALALQLAEKRLEILVAGPRPEAIAEAEAKVASAAVEASAASVRLDATTLKAPRAGTVSSVLCRVGQVLAPGAIAAEIVDAGEIVVTAWVPPPDASLLKAGQEASLRATGAEPMAGKVSSVGWQADPSTGALPVRVVVPNPQGALRLGTVVGVEVAIETVEGALAVPDSAIILADVEPALAVVRDGKAMMLHPRLGARRDGLTEVTVEGLSVGEPVITRGAYDLRDGTPVKVEAPEEKP